MTAPSPTTLAAEGPAPTRCVVFGAGGHARVVIDCLLSSGAIQPVAALDADPSKWGSQLLGVPVVGGDKMLPGVMAGGVSSFIVGVGSVGDSRARRAIFAAGIAAGLRPINAVHRTAVRADSAHVGPGTVQFAGSIINPGAWVGQNVIVNTGAIVEHDCRVHDHVHLATASRLAGAVTVGAGAHIGAGATVIQGITIGEGAIVGAGAVVVRDVPPFTVVAGVPARQLREVSSVVEPGSQTTVAKEG